MKDSETAMEPSNMARDVAKVFWALRDAKEKHRLELERLDDEHSSWLQARVARAKEAIAAVLRGKQEGSGGDESKSSASAEVPQVPQGKAAARVTTRSRRIAAQANKQFDFPSPPKGRRKRGGKAAAAPAAPAESAENGPPSQVPGTEAEQDSRAPTPPLAAATAAPEEAAPAEVPASHTPELTAATPVSAVEPEAAAQPPVADSPQQDMEAAVFEKGAESPGVSDQLQHTEEQPELAERCSPSQPAEAADQLAGNSSPEQQIKHSEQAVEDSKPAETSEPAVDQEEPSVASPEPPVEEQQVTEEIAAPEASPLERAASPEQATEEPPPAVASPAAVETAEPEHDSAPAEEALKKSPAVPVQDPGPAPLEPEELAHTSSSPATAPIVEAVTELKEEPADAVVEEETKNLTPEAATTEGEISEEATRGSSGPAAILEVKEEAKEVAETTQPPPAAPAAVQASRNLVTSTRTLLAPQQQQPALLGAGKRAPEVDALKAAEAARRREAERQRLREAMQRQKAERAKHALQVKEEALKRAAEEAKRKQEAMRKKEEDAAMRRKAKEDAERREREEKQRRLEAKKKAQEVRPKEAPQAKKGASHHDRAPAPAGKPESEQKLLAVFAKAEEVIKAPPAEPRPQPAAAEAAVLDDDEDGFQSIEIAPYRSDEDSSDEEEHARRQPVPKWAQNPALRTRLAQQEHTDPDGIFNQHSMTCSLDEVFGREEVVDARRDLRRRGSTGNWLQDRVTWKEELEYKRNMGYLPRVATRAPSAAHEPGAPGR